MIEVENLTKWYGRTLALDAASFEVPEGKIVGFLGPNGAGKSTTLRILTGYMPATSGGATVNGHDVFRESAAVRTSIGYMPENVPLYPEMKVEEYLAFRARLKGVARSKRAAAVDRVVSRCWLQDMRGRLIGQLSKGYRQRVGLADALVADPPVVVLDEPTIGLDPMQIQEVRELIRSLAGKHTVLLSSHILPEVERTCSHLVIISRGRIAASGSLEELRRGMAGRHLVVLEVAADETGPAEMQRAVEGAQGVAGARREKLGDGFVRFEVRPADDRDIRQALVAMATKRGWTLREVHSKAPALEDLYLKVVAGDAAAGAAPAA